MTLYQVLQPTALFGGVAIGLTPLSTNSYVVITIAGLVGMVVGLAAVLLFWRLTRRIASAQPAPGVRAEVIIACMYLASFVGVLCLSASATYAARSLVSAV
jgi:hypothetical protein